MIKILKEDKNEVDLSYHFQKLQKYHPNISHVDIKDNNAKADIDNLDKSKSSSSSIDDEQI